MFSFYSPLVANGFARAIILRPACTSRVLTTKPFLQLVWAHVDELIELPVRILVTSFFFSRAMLLLAARGR